MTKTYFAKLQEPGIMDIFSRSKTIMKPFSEIVDQTSLDLRSDVTKRDSFSQQVQTELAVAIYDIIECESFTDDTVLLDGTSLLSSPE